MRVVQRVEPLAQPVVARRIPHQEAPVAHLPGHAGDLHHPRRHLLQVHLVGRHRRAVEVEVMHQQLRATHNSTRRRTTCCIRLSRRPSLARQCQRHRIGIPPHQPIHRPLRRANHLRRSRQLLRASALRPRPHILRRRAPHPQRQRQRDYRQAPARHPRPPQPNPQHRQVPQ